LTQTEKDWIFVSDAHLSGREPEEMEVFLRFLNSEKERMSYLVILGDLFEFLFGFKKDPASGKVFSFANYLPVLEGLQMLYRQGIGIKYFEGNHDFFLHSFFSEGFGMEVEVFPEGHEERIGERRAFIAHGDLSNPKLWQYRTFRKMLRNQWTYGLIEKVGPGFSRRVAKWLSQRSYQKNHAVLSSGPPLEFRSFAHQKFLEGFDMVILGHSHFPDEVEEKIEGKRCFYFNVGDWMEHRSFLRYTPPDRFELEKWKNK
jgi:UDP-2,3-diacylglucosamine hydrolase